MLDSFTALFLINAAVASADELCADWERKIEPDMQIQEADFTQEAHDRALKRLQELEDAPDTVLIGFARANATKFVEGWQLRKAALQSIARGDNSSESREVNAFCEFVVTKAFYHD